MDVSVSIFNHLRGKWGSYGENFYFLRLLYRLFPRGDYGLNSIFDEGNLLYQLKWRSLWYLLAQKVYTSIYRHFILKGNFVTVKCLPNHSCLQLLFGNLYKDVILWRPVNSHTSHSVCISPTWEYYLGYTVLDKLRSFFPRTTPTPCPSSGCIDLTSPSPYDSSSSTPIFPLFVFRPRNSC